MVLSTPIKILDSKFIKYSGRGNTFIIGFDEKQRYRKSSAVFCRKFSVDGLITISRRQDNFFMRIFNRDGSEATMCGNGLMCVMHYLVNNRLSASPLYVQTLAATYKGEVERNQVTIYLPFAEMICTVQPSYMSMPITLINSGVFHVLIEVGDITNSDMVIAKRIRNDKTICESGCNVTFFQKTPFGALSRTYEKGVEKETAACGTGAYAVAWFLFSLNALKSLQIQFPNQNPLVFKKRIDTITMTGTVDCLTKLSEANLKGFL